MCLHVAIGTPSAAAMTGDGACLSYIIIHMSHKTLSTLEAGRSGNISKHIHILYMHVPEQLLPIQTQTLVEWHNSKVVCVTLSPSPGVAAERTPLQSSLMMSSEFIFYVYVSE